MSYDLESLKVKEGMQIASLSFSSSTDLAGTIWIATQANAQAILHQVLLQASAFARLNVERATGAASSYWTAFGNQTAVVEGVRIPIDAGSAAFVEANAGIGSGVLRGWFTIHPTPAGGTGGGLSL